MANLVTNDPLVLQRYFETNRALGLNPRAKMSGHMLQDEHALGAVTFGVGNQDPSYQSMVGTAKPHADVVLVSPTVMIDGVMMCKALNAGVKIACGGDPNPAGEFALLEIERLVRAGMGEMETLIAVTHNCADPCGVVDRLATVEVGKLADLIVLLGDPLENISDIRQLRLVLKGGQLVNTEELEGLTDLWQLLFF